MGRPLFEHRFSMIAPPSLGGLRTVLLVDLLGGRSVESGVSVRTGAARCCKGSPAIAAPVRRPDGKSTVEAPLGNNIGRDVVTVRELDGRESRCRYARGSLGGGVGCLDLLAGTIAACSSRAQSCWSSSASQSVG